MRRVWAAVEIERFPSCWGRDENWASYSLGATGKEITVELLQKENEHVTTDQLNTVSNKKKQKALCSGLDSNLVHQSFPSLTHIQKFNHRICLHTETYHICFLLDCTTGLDPETLWSADERQVGWAVGWFFFRHSALRLNRLSDCAAEPEEQRYHRLNGPAVCCDQSGRRGRRGFTKTGQSRLQCEFLWWSRDAFDRDDDHSPSTVLPPDFALLVVEQNVRRIHWV